VQLVHGGGVMCAVSVDGRLDVNVALNRPSWQINTLADHIFTEGYQAKYANDGSHGTNKFTGPCAITGIQQPNPWWGVDLGLALYVAGVKLTNEDTWGKLIVLS